MYASKYIIRVVKIEEDARKLENETEDKGRAE